MKISIVSSIFEFFTYEWTTIIQDKVGLRKMNDSRSIISIDQLERQAPIIFGNNSSRGGRVRFDEKTKRWKGKWQQSACTEISSTVH